MLGHGGYELDARFTASRYGHSQIYFLNLPYNLKLMYLVVIHQRNQRRARHKFAAGLMVFRYLSHHTEILVLYANVGNRQGQAQNILQI